MSYYDACKKVKPGQYHLNVLKNGEVIQELGLLRLHHGQDVSTMSATTLLNLNNNDVLTVELESLSGHKYEVKPGDVCLVVQQLRWF